jgi:AcrR family transcriptional regulator
MSTQKAKSAKPARKYELKARAASQAETRARIAQAAAELHEQHGVAQTSVAEIARRAGVTRLTVYNHFPDLEALLPACAAHYESVHPLPDVASSFGVEEPYERARATLTALYAYYRDTAGLYSRVLPDRVTVPELDAFMTASFDTILGEVAAALSRDRADDGPRRILARLAVDFATWQRLAAEGLDDEAAADLMARAITTVVA